MPTKDELTAENAELKQRIAELEKGGATPKDAEGNDLIEGRHYEFDIDMGFMLVDELTPGAYWKTDGEEIARVAPGTWKVVQTEEGSEDASVIGTMDEDTPVGQMQERIEMLTKDVSAMEIERNDARNEVQRLKAKLADSQTLHGHVDNLERPY